MYDVMAECSELGQVMFDIAMHHAHTPGVDTIDQVYEEMLKILPELERDKFIDNVNEAMGGRKRILTDIQKQTIKLKAEFKRDKSLHKLLDKLNEAIKSDTVLPDDVNKPEPPTAPIAALIDERDRLKEQLKETPANKAHIQSKKEIAAEQRIRDKIMAMDQALEAGEQLPESKKSDPATNPVLQMLREVKEGYEARLENATPVKIKALEKQILALNKAIRIGGHVESKGKGKAHGPDTESVESLKDQRDLLKKKLNQLRQDDRTRRSLLKKIKELDRIYRRGEVPEPAKPNKTTRGAVKQLQAVNRL
jgi:hypothetical protein